MDVAGEKEVSWFGVMLDGQKLKKKEALLTECLLL